MVWKAQEIDSECLPRQVSNSIHRIQQCASAEVTLQKRELLLAQDEGMQV